MGNKRERQREQQRRRRDNPEVRERENAQRRERRADPEVRKRENAQERKRNRRRYLTDPEYSKKQSRRQGTRQMMFRRIVADVIAERDGWVCAHCQTPLDNENHHIGHRHRVSQQDTYPGDDVNELANLILICPSCSRTKSGGGRPRMV